MAHATYLRGNLKSPTDTVTIQGEVAEEFIESRCNRVGTNHPSYIQCHVYVCVQIYENRDSFPANEE